MTLRPSAVLALALTAGCSDPIESVRLPKDAATAESPADLFATAPADPAGGVRWSLPAGWSEKPGESMRLATLVPPSGGEVSVITLPGPAGGTLANVNRWRAQLGLEPVDEAGLRKAARNVRSKAGTLVVVDCEANGTRLVGAILSNGGDTWFFKLTGPGRALSKAKPAFLELLKGLRPA